MVFVVIYLIILTLNPLLMIPLFFQSKWYNRNLWKSKLTICLLPVNSLIIGVLPVNSLIIGVLPVNRLIIGSVFQPRHIQTSSRNHFQRKKTIQSDLVLTFWNSPLIKTSHPKHLWLILDDIPNCKEHLKQNARLAYKGIQESCNVSFQKRRL